MTCSGTASDQAPIPTTTQGEGWRENKCVRYNSAAKHSRSVVHDTFTIALQLLLLLCSPAFHRAGGKGSRGQVRGILTSFAQGLELHLTELHRWAATFECPAPRPTTKEGEGGREKMGRRHQMGARRC